MEMKILRIAPESVDCNYEEAEGECLQVKWSADQEEWEVFENNIRGFSYEPGYAYILRVKHAYNSHTEAWFLVKIIEKQKVCDPHLSEEEIIHILDSKGLILKPKEYTEDEVIEPHNAVAKLHLAKCIWIVTSSVLEAVVYDEADCIETDGCIPEIILTVEAHARTAEILYESKERVLHPNLQ